MKVFIKKAMTVDKIFLDKNEEVYLKGINWGGASGGFKFYVAKKSGEIVTVDASEIEVSQGRT
jgi:hypothetical protein